MSCVTSQERSPTFAIVGMGVGAMDDACVEVRTVDSVGAELSGAGPSDSAVVVAGV